MTPYSYFGHLQKMFKCMLTDYKVLYITHNLWTSLENVQKYFYNTPLETWETF
uniref:Uncharacterized protein n=1 Tax=Anguilla anguilla TaxID=7936 RepID=A0A0E9PG03_ANGAN